MVKGKKSQSKPDESAPVQIVFGVDTMGDALLKASPNPMVRKFGKGPKGKVCGGCTQIVRQNYGPYNWFKCRLRGLSRCNATDHRLSWDVCARYEPRPEGLGIDTIVVGKN